MGIDPRSLLAIMGMAMATVATRLGGPWLVARLPPSPRLARWLRLLPGTILAAIVAPAALDSGAFGVAAAVVTIVVMIRTGRLLIAAALGLVVYLVLNALP